MSHHQYYYQTHAHTSLATRPVDDNKNKKKRREVRVHEVVLDPLIGSETTLSDKGILIRVSLMYKPTD